MSRANITVFKEAQPSFTNVKVLMNWSSTTPFESAKVNFDIREKYKLSDKIIFFYGGSLTTSNDMPNIMRLAKKLVRYTNVHFLILGQGDQFDLINELAKRWELSNVTILPSVSQNNYKMILTQVNVGMFSLSRKYTDHNFPGKLLGYMVESIPILGSCNVGNDLMDLINDSNAGFVHVNGDDDALAKSAIKLIENQEERLNCGLNARSLLEQYFSVEAAYDQILFESNLSN
jgi:glycosyltransferase involved in cell wall biosynthesis